MQKFSRKAFAVLAASTVLTAAPALAEIKIGAVLSLTGPAASLGIPAKQTIDLLPKKIGDQDVVYTVLDDTSDPSAAVRAAKKLMEEEKVDVIIGPSVTPTSLAVVEAAGPGQTVMISLAGSAVVAAPVEGNKQWSFVLAPAEKTMAHYVYAQMAKDGVKNVGYIGFNDAFGDSIIGAFRKVAEEKGFTVVADERFNSKDTSVTAQVLATMAAAPDAIFIGASGTPGVTPILELRAQGYDGHIYMNQGMANPDVLRLGKGDLNEVMLAVSPILVAEQLPDSHPVKAVATDYVTKYEATYGAGSRSLFGGTAWDAFILIENAAKTALQDHKPGTADFRVALRDALEATTDVVGSQGVFNMSSSDHNGTDLRAEVLVQVKDGKWTYVPIE